jgi:5-methylcytosine-specific restriction endonuclease McrA
MRIDIENVVRVRPLRSQFMAYVYPFRNAQESLKAQVWAKGTDIAGYDRNTWRYDKCGKLMKYADHGNRDSAYGWEIDHIKPKALGGGDDITNLQPLHWENNMRKGDTYPWSCS